MRFAGIDPGKTGGVAVFINDRLRWAEPLIYDNPGRLFDTLTKWEVTEIVLERAQGAAGQANQFEYGRAFGRTEAACLMSGAKIHYVAPVWWKARLSVPKEKDRAYEIACEAFPELAWFAPPGERGGLDKVHGMAEAALMGSLLRDGALTQELVKNNNARLQRAERKKSKPKFVWRN